VLVDSMCSCAVYAGEDRCAAENLLRRRSAMSRGVTHDLQDDFIFG